MGPHEGVAAAVAIVKLTADRQCCIPLSVGLYAKGSCRQCLPTAKRPAHDALPVSPQGLPARVTTADIETFFAGLRLASQSPILFKRHADGRTTGAVSYRQRIVW
jgi:hypothetical protein